MKVSPEGIYFLFNPIKWRYSPWEKKLPALFPFLWAVQLRSPEMNQKELRETAFKLKKLLAPAGIPLIINNYPRLAAACGAYGLHLGKKDISIREAKKIFKGVIGASRHSLEGAREARALGADYIGAGPLFPTSTKKMARKSLGIEGFIKIKKEVYPLPVIPIGGINEKNSHLFAHLSRTAAVSSCLNLSLNPAEKARKIKSYLDLPPGI